MRVKEKTMKLHPLINKESSHYDTNETTVIEELEQRLTVIELIGFCKANILKYTYRLETKGQKESDMKKIKTYTNYLKLLETLRDDGHILNTVALALAEQNISFRYR